MIGAGIDILQVAINQASGFSPLSLFASGEEGAWYDPSDLSTMFQDTAGLVPITADGQECLRINDKSPNGNHLFRVGGSTAPVFRDSGGRRWLDFSRTSDALSTSGNVDFSATDRVSVSVAVANTSSTGYRTLVELGNYNSDTYGFTVGFITTTAYFGSRGPTSALAAAAGIVDDAPYVFSGAGEISPSSTAIRSNGLVAGTNAASQGTAGNYRNDRLYVGAKKDGGPALTCKLYGLVVRGATSTAQETSMTEALLAVKARAPLQPIFTKSGPFIPRDQFARDAWDAQIYGPQILQDDDGTYRMFYVAYSADGLTWGPATATSTDLVNWTKPNVGLWAFPEGSGNTNNNLIIIHTTLEPQATPQYDLVDVTKVGSTYIALCMRQGNSAVQLWTSTDGEVWTFVQTAFTGHFANGIWNYAEPKSITYEGGVYRIYYNFHGSNRRSIGFYQSATLDGTFVDQGLRPEFTSVAATLQYYDIRHWRYGSFLWAAVALYNSTSQILGPLVLYRSSDNGVTYTRIGIMIDIRSGEWDSQMVTVAKPILISGVFRLLYSGSTGLHDTWPRPMEMGYAFDAVNAGPWI